MSDKNSRRLDAVKLISRYVVALERLAGDQRYDLSGLDRIIITQFGDRITLECSRTVLGSFTYSEAVSVQQDPPVIAPVRAVITDTVSIVDSTVQIVPEKPKTRWITGTEGPIEVPIT